MNKSNSRKSGFWPTLSESLIFVWMCNENDTHSKQYRFFRMDPLVYYYHATPGEPLGCMVIVLKFFCKEPILCSIKAGTSQQTRDVDVMLVWCWASVADGGPTLNQHWHNVSCILGPNWNYSHVSYFSRENNEISFFARILLPEQIVVKVTNVIRYWRYC